MTISQDRNRASFDWESVEVPLSKGTDLREPARAVGSDRLLVAENVRFDSGPAGLVRRRGHDGQVVRNQNSLTDLAGISLESPGGGRSGGSGSDAEFDAGDGGGGTVSGGTVGGVSVGDDSGWLFGWGRYSGTQETTEHPDAGFVVGAAVRDDETLAHSGFKLYSRNSSAEPGGGHFSTQAVTPRARSWPVAKKSYPQRVCDAAVADGVAMVAFMTTSGQAVYSTYDPDTWAPVVIESQLTDATSTDEIRCIPAGDWVHVLVSDGTVLRLYSLHRSETYVTARDNVGDCAGSFDVFHVTPTTWGVVRVTSTNTVEYTIYDNQGLVAYGPFVLGLGGDDAQKVAGAAHPVTQDVCVVWQSNTTPTLLAGAVYDKRGNLLSVVNSNGVSGVTRITVSPSYLTDNVGDAKFYFWHSEDAGGTNVPFVEMGYATVTDGANFVQTVYRNATLALDSFRVGHNVYVGLVSARAATDAGSNNVSQPGYQRAYYLVGADGTTVGRLEPGTASLSLKSGTYSVWPTPGSGWVNQTAFYGVFPYRVRVDSEDNDQYDEDSVKLYTLDFLPRTRSAQLGRSTYFPGAFTWCYDGDRVTEAGFAHYPEFSLAEAAGGSLPTTGTRTFGYKVRRAWKNAQGEEVMSAAVGASVTTTAANQTVNITIKQLPWTTAKPSGEVYYLVYRTEVDGTRYYLVTDRASPTYEDNSATVTIADAGAVTDTALISREPDPGDSGELEPFAPPATEVIASGRDRLWLAGGELAPGTLLPSLIHVPGVGARFNQFLETVVDRGTEQITAVGFLGHSTVVFRPSAIYAFEADGPNNLGVGGFDVPRVVAADTGAVPGSPVVRSTAGLHYLSPTGFQLLATNYQVVDVGDPVRGNEGDVTAGVLVAADREIRWYTSSGTCRVLDYSRGEWLTWTGLPAAGATQGGDGAVVLAPDGVWLVETDGVWDDAGVGYRARVRTAWLAAQGPLGFARVRKFQLLGDADAEVTLTFKAYYNDRDFPEDEWTWSPDTDLVSDEWGDLTWGAGAWGDTGADTSGSPVVGDRVMEAVRGLARQKCARVSVEWYDNSPRNAGARFTSYALEVGRLPGLNRTPTRTYGG